MEQLIEKIKDYSERKGGGFSIKYNGWSGMWVASFAVTRDDFKVKFTGRDIIQMLDNIKYKVEEKYNIS